MKQTHNGSCTLGFEFAPLIPLLRHLSLCWLEPSPRGRPPPKKPSTSAPARVTSSLQCWASPWATSSACCSRGATGGWGSSTGLRDGSPKATSLWRREAILSMRTPKSAHASLNCCPLTLNWLCVVPILVWMDLTHLTRFSWKVTTVCLRKKTKTVKTCCSHLRTYVFDPNQSTWPCTHMRARRWGTWRLLREMLSWWQREKENGGEGASGIRLEFSPLTMSDLLNQRYKS